MEYEFLCEDGVKRHLNIGADATAPFGCVYQRRLRTSKGEGSALGVHAGKLYVLLDANAESLVATPFTQKDFDENLVELLPDKPPVVSPSDSHRIKRVVFAGCEINTVTQDHNGPCPILAVANALSLLGALRLCPDGARRVRASELRRLILEGITKNKGSNPPEFICPPERTVDGVQVQTLAGLVQHQLDKARVQWTRDSEGEATLCRLYDGMNISPIFSTVDGFDGEEDLLLFPLAGVRVVHGWLISAQSPFAPLREMSFNEVSLIAANTTHENSELANTFLECTKSQLTEEGLAALHHEIGEGEVVVLFWNNHFSTIVKIGGRLLQLLSDETYADRSSVVFEAIEDVHGCVTFTDGDGRNADVLLLAVQSLTGDEFTEKAVMEAHAKLSSPSSKKKSAEEEKSDENKKNDASKSNNNNGEKKKNKDEENEEEDVAEPTAEEIVNFLRNEKRKCDKNEEEVSENKRGNWPSWVREGAEAIDTMGFNIDFNEACQLIRKYGSVSAAVDQLCR